MGNDSLEARSQDTLACIHTRATANPGAATPFRGAAHPPATQNWAASRPCEAYAQEWDTDTSYRAETGGSPEGAVVHGGNSAAPSGPLCFFLGNEKEGAAWRATSLYDVSDLNRQNLLALWLCELFLESKDSRKTPASLCLRARRSPTARG